MRALAFCCVPVVLTLAGCADHDCRPAPKAETRSTADDSCSDGVCCGEISRAALLQKNSAKNDNAVALKTVKFDAFQADLKAERGKVVCAYQWANTSAASKKNLPMLLELQRKFAKDGLVCLTVSNDPAKKSAETLKHLESVPCGLANYLQDETDAVGGWTSCFGCCGFPVLVVFGRDGKQAATFEVTELPFEAVTIEKTLVKLLDAR
jgi:hypothetical protein